VPLSRPSATLLMNRPTPTPFPEGSRTAGARLQFPSWEGSGVGSGEQIVSLGGSWNLSPSRRAVRPARWGESPREPWSVVHGLWSVVSFLISSFILSSYRPPPTVHRPPPTAGRIPGARPKPVSKRDKKCQIVPNRAKPPPANPLSPGWAVTGNPHTSL
jgi:hypothetical protein